MNSSAHTTKAPISININKTEIILKLALLVKRGFYLINCVPVRVKKVNYLINVNTLQSQNTALSL